MSKTTRPNRIDKELAQAAIGLHRAGVVSDKAIADIAGTGNVRRAIEAMRKKREVPGETYRKITAHDVPKREALKPMTAAEIVKVREAIGVSQAVLADALNVSVVLVSKWERGERKPSGPSLKLLTIVKAKGLAAVE